LLVCSPTALLLCGLRSAAAQDPDALLDWGKKTSDALVRFLPNATSFGLSVDPYPLFSAFANETYDYKGAQSLVRKYPSYIVHQTWWFDDAELARQTAEVQKDKDALKQEMDTATTQFYRAHSAEMKAGEQSHDAERQIALSQVQALIQQGKYAEAGALNDKLADKIAPYQYPPLKALLDSLGKRQDDLVSRERALSNRRRQVSFQIHTNRTPTTTAPKFAPKLSGTLAGHPLWRQDDGNTNMGSRVESFVYLAVVLGPPGYQNPRVLIGHKELAVKSIVVWAWIESRPDMIRTDESTVRKVLESIDYDGLSKLIEP